MSSTMFFLLAEFGTGQIPVEDCAKYFGKSKSDAKADAARQKLPVPTFRLGSQKSPWLVSADVLAAYIDQNKQAAMASWQNLNAA